MDSTNGKNKIAWEKTPNSAIKTVNIYRFYGGEYLWAGKVDDAKLSYFDEPLSEPEVVAARYAITGLDACGNESDYSNYHQTIHLGVSKGVDENTVVLDWTEYIDESGDLQPRWYYLYKGTDKSHIKLFDSVDAQVSTEYNDIKTNGAKYYRVTVKKDKPCVTDGLKSDSGPYSQSLSNIAEAQLSTNLKSLATDKEVFPNPFTNQISISLNDLIQGQYLIKIIDINGKAMYSNKIHVVDKIETVLPTDNYAIGNYTL
ncbi:MAG: hypothetical protein IPO21_05180 [Bacteroidales bacterium]|nr:hypothetical protein [Bacteroidales bacterium]